MIIVLTIIVFTGILFGSIASAGLEMVFATTDSSQLRQTPSTTTDSSQLRQTPSTTTDSLSIANEIDGTDVSQLPPLSESVRLTTDNGPLEGMKCYKKDNGGLSQVKCPDVIITTE